VGASASFFAIWLFNRSTPSLHNPAVVSLTAAVFSGFRFYLQLFPGVRVYPIKRVNKPIVYSLAVSHKYHFSLPVREREKNGRAPTDVNRLQNFPATIGGIVNNQGGRYGKEYEARVDSSADSGFVLHLLCGMQQWR
jgi:hypothetical protein